MRKEEFFDFLSTFVDPVEFMHVLENMKRSFRVNTIKIHPNVFEEIASFEFSRVDFIENAYTADVKLGKTVEFFSGLIHTQSLSSMIPPLVLNPKLHSLVLDIAAAPGSKTTQMAAMMDNTGTIVANDKKIDRISALVSNINRLGVLNSVVTAKDGRRIGFENEFDYVLVDAPCSSLGSDKNAFWRWNRHRTKDMMRIQKRLISAGFNALKPGGTLVYSTCTITKEENEGVVDFLLSTFDNAAVEPIDLEIPHSSGLSEFGEFSKKVWRIYPQHFGSEGFFVAKIRKELV